MRKVGICVLLITLLSILTGCCMSHEWEAASCKVPATCSKCGKTEGTTLAHTWIDADCSTPKTCSECGETEGEPIKHDFMEATCKNPSTCRFCGLEEGTVSTEHRYSEANCTEPETCTVCGKTKGEAKGHDWEVWEELGEGAQRQCRRCDDTEKMDAPAWRVHSYVIGKWNGFAVSFYDDNELVEVSAEDYNVTFNEDGTCVLNCYVFKDTYTEGYWYHDGESEGYDPILTCYYLVDDEGEISFSNGGLWSSTGDVNFEGIGEEHLVCVSPFTEKDGKQNAFFIFFEKAE